MTDHDLEQVIFLAIARNRPSKQPAAVLAAIRETHAVIEREWWHRVIVSLPCAPYGYCTSCQRCSPACVCPDRDAEDRWLDGDGMMTDEQNWRPGVGDRVHFQDHSGSSGTVIDVYPDSGVVEIAFDDGRTAAWHPRDLHPGDLEAE